MRVKFLLGPAGYGKTFRCLSEIRELLIADPAGPPLLVLAPKQATFQIERQLLETDQLAGYTRLQVLSFQRLSQYILEELDTPVPDAPSQHGRLMILRALLQSLQPELEIFGRAAHHPGFVQELGATLGELQQLNVSPATLRTAAPKSSTVLGAKLRDLACLLEAYTHWLNKNGLVDGEQLSELVEVQLRTRLQGEASNFPSSLRFAQIWVDGFAELTPHETALLQTLARLCDSMTVALCLDSDSTADRPWLSLWSPVARTFRKLHAELSAVDRAPEIRFMDRSGVHRFQSAPALEHLERSWTDPKPFVTESGDQIRLRVASTPLMEVTAAARDIVQFVRSGGRLREIAIICRSLGDYQDLVETVFQRYEIPCFIDRRRDASLHPLSRFLGALLRCLAFRWRREDFVGLLRSGMTSVPEPIIDVIENQILERGAQGPSLLDFPAGLHGDLKAWLKTAEAFRAADIQAAASEGRLSGVALRDLVLRVWEQIGIRDRIASSDSHGNALLADRQAVSQSVLEQIELCLNDAALAFAMMPLSLSRWVEVIEPVLSNLSVGVVPPALDQVLVGTIDRSRNPSVRLAIVLGANDGVFPQKPVVPSLLLENERDELEQLQVTAGHRVRDWISRERYFAYIACTRSSEKLVVSCCQMGPTNEERAPSEMFHRLKSLFPHVLVEGFDGVQLPEQLLHPIELAKFSLNSLKGESDAAAPLSSQLVERLYGSTLETSVSQLEQFSACPFRFFVKSSLRAEERERFEVDERDRGSFMHALLAAFHEKLTQEGRKWRDIAGPEASDLIRRLGSRLMEEFQNGVLFTDATNRFAAEMMIQTVQRFVAVQLRWMAQNSFNPVAVELGFGAGNKRWPAWEIKLIAGRSISFRGVIDRIDVQEEGGHGRALVVDYKSSAKKLDMASLQHGLQLQLPSYLNVLRRAGEAAWEDLGVKSISPVGLFYVNLKGEFPPGSTRREVLDARDAEEMAFQFRGRFDSTVLPWLDNRKAQTGTQFHYKRTADGFNKNVSDPMETEAFLELLGHIEVTLRALGERVFGGDIRVDPYKKGSETACGTCDYQGICRIDSARHVFRNITAAKKSAAAKIRK